ncbi:MAG: transketolase [Ardenticatenales bacterium]|nr:transketolase [Ardenticatenales bacterium]
MTVDPLLADYRLAYRSRQMSLMARQEVMSGRAKFGGFGDGKELPLLAMARVFQRGDFRSGYYRDQTLPLALGTLTVGQFFAQLYAHADIEAEPNSGGRQMPAHFSTELLDASGNWLSQVERYNSAADLSPTASQMPRLVGLAYASRLYRELAELHHLTNFSRQGNEIAFGIIGNASCAEGLFWESLNAIGVLRAPAIITIMDDAYGISVPNELQFSKRDLAEQLAGFARNESGEGFNLFSVPGWDYPALLAAYEAAAAAARAGHIPAIIHVRELTQPQGHSTSGSHERYKSAERLTWEAAHDGLLHLRQLVLREELLSEPELIALEAEEQASVRQQVEAAWAAYGASLSGEVATVQGLIDDLAGQSPQREALEALTIQLGREPVPRRRPLLEAAFQALSLTRTEQSEARAALLAWRRAQLPVYEALYGSDLLAREGGDRPVLPIYNPGAPEFPGFQILNDYFAGLFTRDPRVLTFGEDVGHLGGVNQTMAGLQAKFGPLRVGDTGIREATIVGQAIGLALRGLRPIAEIQYLDYLLYALQIMADDLATLRWRTVGRQAAPVIVRTRGHRLEGVWHAGSPLAGIINLVRGMHVIVPRDMTRAAGFYNTLMAGADPALVIEPLLGYRQKERLPANLAELRLPLGVPEIIRPGADVTVVTYGALCTIALDAAERLAELGIDVELIDVQTLLPFDTGGIILASLEKTSRILFLDEDLPGGATAYMMQQVIERQGGFYWLDAEPRSLTSKPHRPAYGTDGAYFSKPNAEEIIAIIYDIMNEADPAQYPEFF